MLQGNSQASALTQAALVPGRLALGSTMAFHGYNKLNRKGRTNTAAFFEQVGIRPARPWAIATGAAELFAGLSFITGIATRLGALAVLATQSVAIAKVHRSKGFDALSGGYEFNLSLIAIALELLARGPGRYSVHEVVEQRVKRRGRRLPWRFAKAKRQAKLLDLLG